MEKEKTEIELIDETNITYGQQVKKANRYYDLYKRLSKTSFILYVAGYLGLMVSLIISNNVNWLLLTMVAVLSFPIIIVILILPVVQKLRLKAENDLLNLVVEESKRKLKNKQSN